MILLHNARCSKSREALELLRKEKLSPEVREYLKDALSPAEIKDLLKKLGCKALDIVRKSEPLYKEHYAGKKLTEAQWIKVLSQHPILIERPILIRDNTAVIGRPPELAVQFIKQKHTKK